MGLGLEHTQASRFATAARAVGFSRVCRDFLICTDLVIPSLQRPDQSE